MKGRNVIGQFGRVAGVAVTCLMLFAGTCSAQSQEKSALVADVEKSAAMARSAQDEVDRHLSAIQLAQSAMQLKSDDLGHVTDDTVDGVARLLASDDETVAYYAALALGYFGSRGRRAIPNLLAALADYRRVINERNNDGTLRVGAPTGAGDGICRALGEIGLTPEPPDCMNGEFRYPY